MRSDKDLQHVKRLLRATTAPPDSDSSARSSLHGTIRSLRWVMYGFLTLSVALYAVGTDAVRGIAIVGATVALMGVGVSFLLGRDGEN